MSIETRIEELADRVARLERILIALGLVSQWEINQPPPTSERTE